MRIAAVIVAGGRGTRAGSPGDLPKQYRQLAGRAVIARTVEAFLRHPAITMVQVVIAADDRPFYEAALQGEGERLRPPVAGGNTRQASVFAGLAALKDDAPDLILIHDAARPLIGPDIIGRVIDGLGRHDSVIAAMPVSDTLKRAAADGVISDTVSRDGLWRAQTPQGFHYAAIFAAHTDAQRDSTLDFTDDAAIAEWAGLRVAVVEGSARNIKITTTEDFILAERLLSDGSTVETRNGTGFDVHRFRDGDHVWLCGVQIPHTQALDGHSDADVGLHALTDALLGAIADGDIGQHFPPSDPKWKGAASHLFLRDAARRVRERGGRIQNVDVTMLCEAPRVGPHRDAMRASIADILAIDIGRVGVKATTTEGLGFTGRREGIAAMASATVVLPVGNPPQSTVE